MRELLRDDNGFKQDEQPDIESNEPLIILDEVLVKPKENRENIFLQAFINVSSFCAVCFAPSVILLVMHFFIFVIWGLNKIAMLVMRS